MPLMPRTGRVVVAEARLGRRVVEIEAGFIEVLEVEHLPVAPKTQEVKMADETPDLPALPDPAEVAATWERMRSSVIEADGKHADDIAEAREMIEIAEAERAKLRESYPMFFQGEASEPETVGARLSHPSVDVKNAMLRTLAEHPDQSLKQLARRLGWSRSWCGRILQVITEEHVTPTGSLVERERRNREYKYRVTAAGRAVVEQGGISA